MPFIKYTVCDKAKNKQASVLAKEIPACLNSVRVKVADKPLRHRMKEVTHLQQV